MKHTISLLTGLLALSPTLEAQAAPAQRFAAVFDRGGSVSWDEFYLELARRHRGRTVGREALDHLLEKRVVELEAARREVDVAAAEVDATVRQLERQLAAQRIELAAHLANRGMSMAEFRDYVRLSKLYERLARTDLGLAKGERLSADKRKLWLRERQRHYHVITDVRQIPPNVAATIGKETVTLRDLGEAMARSLVVSDRRAILRQMCAFRILKREAMKLGLEVKATDQAAALAKKRKEYESKPQFKKLGLTLEKLLAAEGRTVADLQQGEVFRAEVLIAAIGNRKFPESALQKDYRANVLDWQSRIGTSRDVQRILIKTGPQRDVEKAEAICRRLGVQLHDAKEFAAAAARFSDDPSGKRRGGRIGWLHRKQHGYSDAFLKAVFRQKLNEVSGPIRDDEGVSLVLVTATQPGPTGAAVWEAMRHYEMSTWLRRLVDAAKIEYRALPSR